MNIGHKITGGMAAGYTMLSTQVWAHCVHGSEPGAGILTGDPSLGVTSNPGTPIMSWAVVIMGLLATSLAIFVIGKGVVMALSAMGNSISSFLGSTEAGSVHSADNEEIKSLEIQTHEAIEALELEYETKLIEALSKNTESKKKTETTESDHYTLTSV